MEMNKKAGIKNFNLWLKLCLTVFFPPLLLLIAGTWFLADLSLSAKLQSFETEATEKLEILAINANTDKYICTEVNNLFVKSATIKNLQNNFENFLTEHGIKADFLIWRKNGKVAYSNFEHQKWKGNWKKAYFDLIDFDQRKYESEAKIPNEVYANLRKLFGPHFFPRYHHRSYRGMDTGLLFNDSSKNKPLLWLKTTKKFGMAAFFDYEILNTIPGLENHLKKQPKEYPIVAAIYKNRVISGHEKAAEIINHNQPLLKKEFKQSFKSENHYIFSHFIDENLTGLCFFPLPDSAFSVIPARFKAGIFITIAVLFFLVIKSYLILVKKQKFAMLLKKQLLLLFIFSNALPGTVLGFLSIDYLQQFQNGQLNSSYNHVLSYLQDIDDLYESEFTFQKNSLEKSLPGFIDDIKTSGINGKAIRNLLHNKQPPPYRLFLVGSATELVASNEAVMRGDKIIDLISDEHLRGPHKKQQLHALEKIGKYYLALLNRKPISSKMGTEVEMLSESLSQQEPVELMQEFLHRDGGFWNWGIGQKRHPAYIRMMKLFAPEIFDYLFLYLWDDNHLQQNFMERSFERFSRNEHGVKIMAVVNNGQNAMPKAILKDKKLSSFAARLKEKSTRKIDYCSWEGKEWLLVGLKGNRLYNFRLLGLLPLENIERQVRAKAEMLMKMALLSLLITISLGMFVAGSVLEPLANLEKGINALKKREFSYRLPDLGKDEFGRLAEIFNTTLVDLEEMHTASIFKDKIFAPLNGSVKLGNYSIFGQTQGFAGSGSDCLEICDNHILIGDVAGSGIAATLIVAFIKSALMQLEEFSQQPSTIVAELEKLLKVSAGKGKRRFVAFQYLLVNGSEIKIVNAGLMFPIIINRLSGETRQIGMPSPPLGAGSSAVREEKCLSLAADEVMILFSNGLSGKVAYEELFQLLSQLDLSSPETCFADFNKQIKQRYSPMLNDDVTMVVIMPLSERNEDATKSS